MRHVSAKERKLLSHLTLGLLHVYIGVVTRTTSSGGGGGGGRYFPLLAPTQNESLICPFWIEIGYGVALIFKIKLREREEPNFSFDKVKLGLPSSDAQREPLRCVKRFERLSCRN